MSGHPEIFTAEILRLEKEHGVSLLNRDAAKISPPCPHCMARGWFVSQKKDQALEICPVCEGHGSEA